MYQVIIVMNIPNHGSYKERDFGLKSLREKEVRTSFCKIFWEKSLENLNSAG